MVVNSRVKCKIFAVVKGTVITIGESGCLQ